MIEKLYNDLLNNQEIKDIYESIGASTNEEAWVYHDLTHVMNVVDMVENILSELNYDSEFVAIAKIAALFHDVGVIDGKNDHALRSYEFTKKFFHDHNISFDGDSLVLEAIKNHSDGFDTNNVIALALILADKLDVKKTRITEIGSRVIGNRQLCHIIDIKISITSNTFVVNFITDGNINIDEINSFYFTEKIFTAIKSFSKIMNLDYKILMDNDEWIINKKI